MLKRALEAVAHGVGRLRQSSDHMVLDVRPRLQVDGFSCGLQSLAAILDYHGFDVDLDELADDVGLTEDGCDENDMRKAIRAYGLKHRSMHRMSLRRLQTCIDDDEPVLVALNGGGHWSVAHGYGADCIYVMDPLPGRALVGGGRRSLDAFLESWDGWGIAVSMSRRRAKTKKKA